MTRSIQGAEGTHDDDIRVVAAAVENLMGLKVGDVQIGNGSPEETMSISKHGRLSVAAGKCIKAWTSRFAAAVLVAAAAQPAGASGLSDRLLLSTTWCAFSYNAVSHHSSTTRVRFHPGGTYSMGGQGVTNSGVLASQHDRGASGYWRVHEGELYINEGDGFAHVQTLLGRNSNGWPIIKANGVEYMPCN